MDPETRFLVTDRFYVDRRSETLVVDGKPVPIHHRTYQVLLELMSRPKELVTKRELFENIWGTLEVTDAVLTTAVKELRQALGDDARTPWAVATRCMPAAIVFFCASTPVTRPSFPRIRKSALPGRNALGESV